MAQIWIQSPPAPYLWEPFACVTVTPSDVESCVLLVCTRFNVVETLFVNEALDYEQDVVHWPPTERWPPFGLYVARLHAYGIVTASQALRHVQEAYAMFHAVVLQEGQAIVLGTEENAYQSGIVLGSAPGAPLAYVAQMEPTDIAPRLRR